MLVTLLSGGLISSLLYIEKKSHVLLADGITQHLSSKLVVSMVSSCIQRAAEEHADPIILKTALVLM